MTEQFQSHKNNNNDQDSPLPLLQLKKWISNEDYLWIQEGDEKQKAFQKEMEENSAYNVSNLFGDDDSDDDDSNGDDGDENGTNDINIKKRRVQQWRSSSKCLDGIGGYQPKSASIAIQGNKEEDTDNPSTTHVKLVFILSESYKGFGDTLWSSSRYVANVISNPEQCREMILPLLLRRRQLQSNQPDDDDVVVHSSSSPLFGLSFLELGAGAGVPSWAAMHCGARVICTDLSDTNRIRSMGECAERNYQLMMEQYKQQQSRNEEEVKEEIERDSLIYFGEKCRVCPHDWGTSVDNVTKALNQNGQEKFDVIVAADCCYMPWLHDDLLNSIYNLLSDVGVSIISFALHGNTDDDDVWKIVDRARDRGFGMVEVLKSQQLTPPSAAMDDKQGLVHTVRLGK